MKTLAILGREPLLARNNKEGEDLSFLPSPCPRCFSSVGEEVSRYLVHPLKSMEWVAFLATPESEVAREAAAEAEHAGLAITGCEALGSAVRCCRFSHLLTYLTAPSWMRSTVRRRFLFSAAEPSLERAGGEVGPRGTRHIPRLDAPPAAAAGEE